MKPKLSCNCNKISTILSLIRQNEIASAAETLIHATVLKFEPFQSWRGELKERARPILLPIWSFVELIQQDVEANSNRTREA
jgi:hypothetical protein